MDTCLLNYLKNLGIKYKIHEHPAVFTVEEAEKLNIMLPDVFHTKNLFLKDEKNNFYLVCMNAHKRLNLKKLKEKLNIKGKLHFASPTELKEKLNLKPGSVSIFGMIYAKNVLLIIDKELWEAKKVGFHPNVNTSTLELSHEDLEKFCNSLNIKKQITELEP